MSYSTVKVIQSNGDVVSDIDLGNSHGVGSCVWDSLLRKYRSLVFPKESLLNPSVRPSLFEWDDLWKWVNDNPTKVRWWEHNTLNWTYDRALTKREDVGILAESLRRFEDALVLPDRVCHLRVIADRMDELLTDESIRGFGIRVTSLSGYDLSPISVDDEYERPYNIDQDSKHWWVEIQRP